MIAGTSADHVHRYSAIHSQKLRTRNRRGITTEPPVNRVEQTDAFSVQVVQRQNAQCAVCWREPVGYCRVPASRNKAAVGVDRPLRLARAPRCIDQDGFLIRLDIRQKTGVESRFLPGRAVINVGLDNKQVPADLTHEILDHRMILVRHENHLRIGVLQHIEKLRPSCPDVQWDRHKASVHGSQEEPGREEAVVHHESDLIARAASQFEIF